MSQAGGYPMKGGMNGNGGDFVCITCHRGPPFTRKYAKNQCQTCYKKTKKFQKDTDDYYNVGSMMNQQSPGFN